MYHLEYSRKAFHQLEHLRHNSAYMHHLSHLLDVVSDDPFSRYPGRTEELTAGNERTYSRRIDDKNRLWYSVDTKGEVVHLLSLEGHYNDT